MIDAWTWPAYVGVLLGSLLFVVLLVPLLIVQSRRLGRLSALRLVGAAAVAVYLTALAFYTLFPLPGPDWCADNTSPAAQLVPLQSLDDIARATAGLSWTRTVLDVSFLQVAFNVLLFVPFGVLGRRVLEIGAWPTIAAGVATSALIETIQGTGGFGVVGCAYRVADVDDLITNSLGTVIGVLVAPAVLFWMPRARRLASERREDRPVTRLRRLAAMLVDAFVLLGLSAVLTVGYRATVHYGLGRPLPDDQDWLNQAVPQLIALLVVLTPCLVGSHASWGQRALWLRPEGRGWVATLRPALGLGLYGTLALLSVVPPLTGTGTSDLLAAAATALAVVSVVAVLLDRSARGLSFRLTGLHLVDVRSPDRAETVGFEMR